MEKSSVSDTWREKGNTSYKQATQEGQSSSPQIKSQLQEAIHCYCQAEEAAATSDEEASAQKNYSIASWKLAKVQRKMGEDLDIVHSSLKDGFSYCHKAIQNGCCKTAEWQKELHKELQSWFEFSLEFYKESTDGKARARHLEEIALVSPDGDTKASCFLAIGQVLFHQGIKDSQDGNFKSSLSLSHDCYYPIEEADRLATKSNETLRAEINGLREEVFTLTCISESVQARTTGDNLLQRLLMDEEELDMGLVFSAIDWYRNAAILTRGKEIEYEAITLGRLGRLYDKVLKMMNRAKDYYMKCIELALTLLPKSPENEDWYKEAKAFIEKIQQEKTAEERREWDKVRKEHLAEIKDDLKKLNEFKGEEEDEALLRHIYKAHPPKKEKHVLPDTKSPWDSATVKKAIMNALSHYHPDKIDLNKHGAKWKVLCEEIAKTLNGRYMHYK